MFPGPAPRVVEPRRTRGFPRVMERAARTSLVLQQRNDETDRQTTAVAAGPA